MELHEPKLVNLWMGTGWGTLTAYGEPYSLTELDHIMDLTRAELTP